MNRNNREKNLEILKAREDLILKMVKAVQNPATFNKTALDQFLSSYQELSRQKNIENDNFKKFEKAFNKNLNFLSKKVSATKSDNLKSNKVIDDENTITVDKTSSSASNFRIWEKKTPKNKSEKNIYEHKIIELGGGRDEDIIIAAPNNVLYQVKNIDLSWTLAGLCKLLAEKFPDDFKEIGKIEKIYFQHDEMKIGKPLNKTNFSSGDIFQIGEKRNELADFNGTTAAAISRFTDTKKHPITIEVANRRDYKK